MPSIDYCQEEPVLSITTDYLEDTGCPERYLRSIAAAGFTHVHWCHHWNTDFLYSRPEIEQAAAWLRDFGLALTDLHASAGREKAWGSAREYERLAGVELVKNRIEMTARLGADVIIMHLPGGAPGSWRSPLRKSLDELRPYAAVHGVRIALENGSSDESFDAIERVLAEYGPDYLGLCYDSGHANMLDGGLRRFERLKDRLISIHLHDNDGTGDQHNLIFSGTTDWARVAVTLASSSYEKCVSMEVTTRNSGIDDEQAFLKTAFGTGARLSSMVEDHR
jgi:sugar phosphate isomerase/epimerase